MAKQTIGIGTTANDGTGDPIRTGGNKINDNFTDLYNRTDGNSPHQVITARVNWSNLSAEFQEQDLIWAAVNADLTHIVKHDHDLQFRTVRKVYGQAGSIKTYDVYETYWQLRDKLKVVNGNNVSLGTGNTQLDSTNGFLVFAGRKVTKVIDGVVQEGGFTRDFGVTGATPIEDSVNGGAIAYPSKGLYLFKGNDGVDDYLYIYEGDASEIGTGSGVTTSASDFSILTEADADPADGSQQTIKLIGDNAAGLEAPLAIDFVGANVTQDPITDHAIVTITSSPSESTSSKNIEGDILNLNKFASLTAFTDVNGITSSIVSEDLRVVSANDNAENDYFTYDSRITDLEKFKAEFDYKLPATIGTTDNGLGIGLYPEKGVSGGYGMEVHLRTDSTALAANGGYLILKTLNNGVYTEQVNTDGTSNLIFAADDVVRISYKLYDGVVTMLAKNITTGSEISATYTFTIPTPNIPNVSKFAFWNHGGTYDIKRISLVSLEYYAPNLIVVGDSKSRGYNADSYRSDYASQLNDMYGKITNLSGGSERTADVASRTSEIIGLKPNSVLLNIGSNDKRDGTSAAVWGAEYDAVVSTLETAGIRVFHLLQLNETVLDFTDYNAHLTSTYRANLIVNAGTVTLDGDGVHPNQSGHDQIATAIENQIGERIKEEYVPYVSSNLDKEPSGSQQIFNTVFLSNDDYANGVKIDSTIYFTPSGIYKGLTEISGGTIAPSSIYDGSTAYSLQKIFTNWTKAFAKVRRSSDNAQIFLFFNGDDISTAVIGNTNSVASATTFATWYGTDSVFLEELLPQSNTNVVDTGTTAKQTTTTLQPRVVNAGTLYVKNGKPSIDFTIGNVYLKAVTGVAGVGSAFSILTVTHNELAGDVGGYMSNNEDANGFSLYSSRNVSTFRIAQYTPSGGTTVTASALAVDDTNNQKLLTSIHNATDLIVYKDGSLQETVATVGASANNVLFIGKRFDENYINGGIQEIIIFPTDKTADIAALHTDMNTRYSIY